MLVDKSKEIVGDCFPYQDTKSLDKRKKMTKEDQYVHACDLLVEAALADVTVSIPRERLLLQYDGWLIQQVILSEC